MEGSRNNIVLLFLCKLYKINGIARYSYSELRIFFRMSLSVEKSFSVKYVYIKVVSALFSVTVKQSDQIVYLCFVRFKVCHKIISFLCFRDSPGKSFFMTFPLP